MKDKRHTILYIIGFGLLIYFLNSIDYNITKDSIQDYRYIPVSIMIFLMTFLITAQRMRYFLKSIEKGDHDIKTLMKIEFISRYIYYITPSKMYLPAKAYLLSKKYPLSKSKSLAVMTFEYAVDTITTIILAIIGTIFLFSETSGISGTRLTAILAIILISALAFIFLPERHTKAISKKIQYIRFQKLKSAITKLQTLLSTTKNTWKKLAMSRNMTSVTSATLIQVFTAAYSTKLIFLSAGYNIPLIWVIAVNASAIFIGGISQIPGGIGIREGTGILLYTTLGINRDISALVVIISRIYTILPLIIGYILSLNFTKETQKVKKNNNNPIC